jgi:hypothetical protein
MALQLTKNRIFVKNYSFYEKILFFPDIRIFAFCLFFQ